MITPLCTQLTYAGLASEAYKVADGVCLLPPGTTVADGKSKVTVAGCRTCDLAN